MYGWAWEPRLYSACLAYIHGYMRHINLQDQARCLMTTGHGVWQPYPCSSFKHVPIALHGRPYMPPSRYLHSPSRPGHQIGRTMSGRHRNASTRLEQGSPPSSPGSRRGIGPSGSCWAGTCSGASHCAPPRAGRRRTRRPAAHTGCVFRVPSGCAAGRAPWSGQARHAQPNVGFLFFHRPCPRQTVKEIAKVHCMGH